MSRPIYESESPSTSLVYGYLTCLRGSLSTSCGKFFVALMYGILFAVSHRRTVTTWIIAANLFQYFRQSFYHLPQIGKHSQKMLQQILSNLIAQNRLLFETASSIRLIADDSPTKHYGKKIEGCGWHHNPTPGGSDATLCWGHSWVVICLVLTHPLWGEVCFPIATTLYVQQKVVDLLKGKYKIEFKTKCAILVDLVTDLMPYFEGFPCRIEVIMDGGYAKESVIKPLCKLQKVCVIT